MSKITEKIILKYLSIVLGAGILAFGIYNIHSRCAISEGGVLGLSLLFQHWFHLTPAISNPIMDLMAIIAGTIVLKKSFLWDSILASACYALWYGLWEWTGPILPSFADYPFVASLLGGVFVGIGASLIVMHGCAAGADDSLALIFQEKTKWNISVFYVASDMTVLLLSLTYIPFVRIGWSIMSVLISSGIIALFCRKQKEN